MKSGDTTNKISRKGKIMKQVKQSMVLFLSILFILLFYSPLRADINDVVSANNRFSFDLYSNLAQKDDNIFISPYSISTALAMTYEGARGKTAEEMEKVFYFPEDSKARREGFLEIINEINKKDKKYKLHTANALWVEKTYKLLDDYLKVIERYYQGKATNLGFIDSSEREQSRVMINAWVEAQTSNKIREILKPDALSSDTRLVLTNAIYFKGDWQTQFDKGATKEEDFKITPEKKVKVQMMRLTGKMIGAGFKYPEFKYVETDDLQAIELPYDGSELSMLILLPKDSLESVERTLNYERIKNIREKLENYPVEVYMPKFKLEREYLLNSTLIKMGMPSAFSDSFADFSGMDGTKKLKMGKVIHKAFVEVNEEGTEAAAATVVEMIAKVAVQEFKKPVSFRADHPFLFIIQHNKTGAILFIGRVYDPGK